MKNEIYEAPVVEVIEVEVEKGFAASIPIGGSDTPGAPGFRGDWVDFN